jgi:hypothetical protein
MSVLNNCWDNIVGITRNGKCLDKIYRPVDYNTSLSGLYLDELKGIDLKIVESTGGDIWDKVSVSYENAVRAFKMDVMAEILKTHKTRYDNFIGNIGSQRFTRNLSLNKSYAGIRMYCNDIKGGLFTLKSIGVIMDKTETFDIDIYDNLSEDIQHTIEVSSIANKVSITNLQTPIELQLSVDNWDNLEYYFLYNRGTKQPKDNKPTCGCGGVHWCFKPETPCFADAKQTKDRWRQYAMIGGIQGDDIAIREEWGVTQEMNGIILIGEFNCDKFSYLCNSNMDFEVDEIGQAVAHAIAYKWGEFTMDYFLDTKEVSRYTTLGIESINNNREYYNARYAVMIDFIASNLDTEKYGCLSCKPVQNARLSRQLL